MALTKEDGTIVAGADTFVTLAEGDTYFALHGSPTQWTGATDALQEAALRAAARYLTNKFKYKGMLEDLAQALPFPRSFFYDSEGRILCGTGIIPQAIKDAQCELALRHLTQDLFFNSNPASTRIKSKTIGDVSETYDNNKAVNNFAFVNDLISEYIVSAKSGVVYMKKGG